MPAYVPNATQTTEPVESRTVESAALEFRTLKTSINSRIADLEAKDNLLDAEDAALQAEIDAVEVRTTALEQLAFNGSTPGTVVVQRFTTDAVQTAFTLDVTPVTVAAVDAYINGIYQNHNTFSVVGNVVTFTEAPTVGVLELQVSVPLQLGVTTADAVEYTPAGTGAVATTVQSKLLETVSVKDFGAVGDGVTDDTAAIQAALNSAKTVEGVSGSTYLVTGGITVPAATTLKNIKLKLKAGSNRTVLTLSQDAAAYKVFVDGNGSNNLSSPISSAAIYASGVSSVSVTECKVTDSFASGIRLDNCDDFVVDNNTVIKTHAGFTEHAGIYILTSTNGSVAFNKVVNSESTGIKTGTNCFRLKIEGNDVRGSYYIGLANDTLSDSVIVGNIATSNGDNGIDVNGSTNVVVSSNTCVTNTTDGIYVGENNVNRVTVVGNTCHANGRAGFGCVANFWNFAVTGNTFSSNVYGIQIADGYDSTVANNIVIGNTAAAFYFTTGANSYTGRMVFEGNVVRDNAAVALKQVAAGGSQNFSDNRFAANIGLTVTDFTGLGWNTTVNNLEAPNSEFGSWTPGVSFGGSSTGITYAQRVGRYLKVGNTVTCYGSVVLSAAGSSTGNAKITGLPFSANGVGYLPGGGNCALQLNTTGVSSQIALFADGGASTAGLYQISSGNSVNVTSSNFLYNTQLYFVLTYVIA